MGRTTGKAIVFAAIFTLFLSRSLFAHFQVIIPDKPVLNQNTGNTLEVKLAFMHPFEQKYMFMARPKEVGVFVNGIKRSLGGYLIKHRVGKIQTWSFSYTVRRPGDYIFYVIPSPYFEPSEGRFIKHLAKVVVNAYGLETGWDKPVGLEAEIVPLTRPYGLYKGETFRGLVLFNGKPAPYTRVEITYFNKGNTLKAPYDIFFPQVVLTDGNGVFSFTMPKAGWWGFAALSLAKEKISKNGKRYPVELGAVIWVRAEEIK